MKFHYFNKKSMLALLLVAAFSMQMNAKDGVRVSPKLYLAGAYRVGNGLMDDGIRAQGLLPLKEPYSTLASFTHYGGGGGETVTSPAVFQVTGNDAIVDWVMVELRSGKDLTKPLSTRSALLQRDGDVVSTDGVSPVRFTGVNAGNYHVIVRHRNHLGVMTAKALALSNATTSVDFTSTGTLLYGANPTGTIDGKRVMWLGDANQDKKVVFQGPNNDLFNLFSVILGSSENTTNSGNYMKKGYLMTDFNMDGFATFYGPDNDKAYSFQQTAIYGKGLLNIILTEQIPE